MAANDPYDPAVFGEALGRALYQYSIGTAEPLVRQRLLNWYPQLGTRFASQVIGAADVATSDAEAMLGYDGPGNVSDLLQEQGPLRIPVVSPGTAMTVRALALFEDEHGNSTTRSFDSNYGPQTNINDIGGFLLARARIIFSERGAMGLAAPEGMILFGVIIVGAYGSGG